MSRVNRFRIKTSEPDKFILDSLRRSVSAARVYAAIAYCQQEALDRFLSSWLIFDSINKILPQMLLMIIVLD